MAVPVAAPSRTWRIVRRIAIRLAAAILVLWAAATVTFFALRMVPGDPALAILGGPGANPTPEAIAQVTEQYGLDEPLVVQYATYLGNLATGDLGQSPALKRSVVDAIAEAIVPTLQLTVAALVLAWVLALLTVLLTVRRRRAVSSFGSGLEILSSSLPQFWLGLMLLVVFAFHLNWFPVSGGSGLRALVLPAFALAIPLAGFLGQATRESFESAMEQPFVTSARARGMSDRAVRLRHALRHALLPGLTISGWAVGFPISGAVVVETVFARPGLGRTLLIGVLARDLSLTVGIVLLLAAVYVAVNLVVDSLYPIIDPRIRTG